MDMSGLRMGIDKENQESPTVEVPLKKDMFIMFSGPPGRVTQLYSYKIYICSITRLY